MDLSVENRIRRVRRYNQRRKAARRGRKVFVGVLFIAVGCAVLFTAGNTSTVVFGAGYSALGTIGLARP